MILISGQQNSVCCSELNWISHNNISPPAKTEEIPKIIRKRWHLANLLILLCLLGKIVLNENKIKWFWLNSFFYYYTTRKNWLNLIMFLNQTIQPVKILLISFEHFFLLCFGDSNRLTAESDCSSHLRTGVRVFVVVVVVMVVGSGAAARDAFKCFMESAQFSFFKNYNCN